MILEKHNKCFENKDKEKERIRLENSLKSYEEALTILKNHL